MAFRFRFETLLQYRDHLLEKARLDLSAAISTYESVKIRREAAERELKVQRRLLEEKRRAGIKMADYLLSLDYQACLEQQIAAMEEKLHELSEQVDSARAALIQREKEVRVLECLQERDAREYQKDRSKRMQKDLDEKANLKTCRIRNE